MRTLLIDANGEASLGDRLPEPLPTVLQRLADTKPLRQIAPDFGACFVEVDTFRFCGYVALKDGRNVLAIYEQS